MSICVAVDPGPLQTAWLVYSSSGLIITKAIEENIAVLARLESGYFKRLCATQLAIEMIASYGMSVGAEVFETCLWIGRYIQAWGGSYTKVYRKDVKMHLCGTNQAKDSNVRQAILDRFGGKEKAIGKKQSPGPLHGVSSHCWAALAVGITYTDKYGHLPEF